MKIVSINSAPTVCNEDGDIRGDVTSLDHILNHIDHCNGRNDALRAYIYALRDLQYAHNESMYVDSGVTDADIDRAQAAVAECFDRLIVAEFSLNRGHDDGPITAA
jgi:hypothetical protein